MKNIKNSIILTMIIVTSTFGMDELSPTAQLIKFISSTPQILMEIYNKQQEQERIKENHQIAKDNHKRNQEQAKFQLKVDHDNHVAHRQSMMNEQQFNFAKKRSEIEKLEDARWGKHYETELEEKRAKAESEKLKAEHILSKCLINHRYSSDLGRFGIPEICEDPAKVLRLLGYGSKVDELINAFQE
jgi:membrane protein involved in colicin uptake